MPFTPISAVSLEYVSVGVSTFLGSNPPNPTGDVVQMAFNPTTQSTGTPLQPPVTADWKTAAWLPGAAQPYIAVCLVGPGGGQITLTAGNWNVWIKITDNPEIPARFVGILTVY